MGFFFLLNQYSHLYQEEHKKKSNNQDNISAKETSAAMVSIYTGMQIPQEINICPSKPVWDITRLIS